MRKLLLSLLLIIILNGCNLTEPAQNLPVPIPDAKLITPQQDYINETQVQINPSATRIYYIESRMGQPDLKGIAWQDIDSIERHIILPISYNRYLCSLQLSANESYLAYLNGEMDSDMYLRIFKVGINDHEVKQLTHVDSSSPYISPDGNWIAFWGDYSQNGIGNIYIMTPVGDIDGPVYQVTHDQYAVPQNPQDQPIGVEASIPLCWLSNHELVVKTIIDWLQTGPVWNIYLYDINDLSAPPRYLYTVQGNNALGYSQCISPNQGWYLFSPVTDWNYDHIHQAPIGVPNNYGTTITYGEDQDIPGGVAANGTTVVFVRQYKFGSEFLTGEYDVYLMNLD